ncbi:MAG TPA: hypothetical protein VJK48_02545 [Chlamydiales bacterium]|nr:MAG: hypothetical protein A3F67_11920 [Verrucomicrobia bacterium RIFCSPHIGHO2_12_FULL_41_10]HLB52572.1 hypothetical protein [Chlamydiales bacterium]
MEQFFAFIRKQRVTKIFSLIAIVAGTLLVLFTRRSMHKVEQAKSTADHMTDFFTNGNGMWNPVIKFFGGQVQKEASKYDATLSTLLALGIALIILGFLILIWNRHRFFKR